MRKRLTSALDIISDFIPQRVYPWIVRRGVIDFFWHAVSDEPMPHVEHLYPVVSTADFKDALLYLKANCSLINYSQLHAHIFGGASLPPRAVHLSFDDGYRECFSVVRPLLLEHKIPCTFFLTTSLIDNSILFYRNKQSLCLQYLNTDASNASILEEMYENMQIPSATLPEFTSWFKNLRLPDEERIDEIGHALGVDLEAFLAKKEPYLTRDQIQQMHAEGFTIGAHTLTHRKLVDLPESDIETEIAQSCQIVGEVTGQSVVPFSFPHSAWGLDREQLAAIRARHPDIGLLFDTKGLRRDVDFIQNRVWAERPLADLTGKGSGAAALKAHLRQAYQEAWVDHIFTIGRRISP
jgi:peptidoglycan/xylan/chitin deacetylase (PgdA/CDA1 family)